MLDLLTKAALDCRIVRFYKVSFDVSGAKRRFAYVVSALPSFFGLPHVSRTDTSWTQNGNLPLLDWGRHRVLNGSLNSCRQGNGKDVWISRVTDCRALSRRVVGVNWGGSSETKNSILLMAARARSNNFLKMDHKLGNRMPWNMNDDVRAPSQALGIQQSRNVVNWDVL